MDVKFVFWLQNSECDPYACLPKKSQRLLEIHHEPKITLTIVGNERVQPHAMTPVREIWFGLVPLIKRNCQPFSDDDK
jgi:hypothetical protein